MHCTWDIEAESSFWGSKRRRGPDSNQQTERKTLTIFANDDCDAAACEVNRIVAGRERLNLSRCYYKEEEEEEEEEKATKKTQKAKRKNNKQNAKCEMREAVRKNRKDKKAKAGHGSEG